MRIKLTLILLLLCAMGLPDLNAAQARIKKVLPHYLDLKGRHVIHPSLYERDAYQAYLRRNPDERSGVRFDVHLSARGLEQTRSVLRVEMRGLRGNEPTTATLASPVNRGGWHAPEVRDGAYQDLGQLVAWRVSVWDGDTLLAEQKSFLW